MNTTGWKPSTETFLNLVQTAAILTGIIFGLRELGELRKSRELDATLKLVDVIENESTGMGTGQLMMLPANLSEEEFERRLGDDLQYVMSLASTYETLGILVYRREVSLDLVDEMFGGVVVTAWERLGPFIARYRQRTGKPETFEWFQWLAERLQEHRGKPGTAPAYVKYRTWRP
jgi:hypothetical protein